jgi:outer membrane protein OmpA-like peptidoglycan-associated protein
MTDGISDWLWSVRDIVVMPESWEADRAHANFPHRRMLSRRWSGGADMADALMTQDGSNLYGVNFEADETDIKPESTKTLNEVASLLKSIAHSSSKSPATTMALVSPITI